MRFEELGEVVAVLDDTPLADKVLGAVPFKSKAIRWKEEVYFHTPIRLEEGEELDRVSPGTLAFWKPENCLCLFYGQNQPYGRVVKLGRLLGPLYYLRWVEDGVDVYVEKYIDYGRAGEVAKALRESGIPAACREWEDTASVIVGVDVGLWVGAEVFVEDYGLIVESDALFLYDQSAFSVAAMDALRKELRDPVIRVDISEESYAVLSAVVNDLKELPRVLRKMAVSYKHARRLLQGLLRVF